MSLVNGYTITLLCAVLCECMSSEVSVSPLVRGGRRVIRDDAQYGAIFQCKIHSAERFKIK